MKLFFKGRSALPRPGTVTILSKKILSLFVAISFLCANVALPAVTARAVSSGEAPAYAGKAASPLTISELGIYTLEIPHSMGRIVSRHAGDGTRRVIHIRDAHCDVQVQNRINGILGFLRDRYGVDVVNLEGGEGRYDLGMFISIEEPAVRRRVSELFLDTGVINGAEFSAVNSRGNMYLWGVENRGLYRSNLDIYLDTAEIRRKALEILDELDLLVRDLAEKVYGPELLALERMKDAYADGKTDLVSYQRALNSAAGSCGIPVRERSQIDIFMEVCRSGERLDFEKAEDQRDRLIGQLRRDLSISEARELDERAEAFSGGRDDRVSFHKYLASKAGDIGITEERYPDLFEYVGYLSRFGEMDPYSAEKQAERLLLSIEDRLCREDAQRQLLVFSRGLRFMRSLFSLRLHDSAFREYEKGGKKYLLFPQKKVLTRLAAGHDAD
ncbi:MAG: hypothetical protein GF392_02730, partial [Candidatus Omnitrophica bacterium]|nr:hypothetical protein [Candidatus Omnitrophota bacterium]